MRKPGAGRRAFMVVAGVVGGGLLAGVGVAGVALHRIGGTIAPLGDGRAAFGAWLRLAKDGMFEVIVPHQEMGQGIHALACLLAAEGLRVPITAVRAVAATDLAIYANPIMLIDGLPMDEHANGLARHATVWTLDKVLAPEVVPSEP